MQITPEQWPELSRLLDEALELDAPTRERWLCELPASAAGLDGALRALLAAHARVETSDFLGALPRLEGLPGEEGEGLAPGTVIGGYVVEREAGRGGMSVVYRAHRADGVIRRPVAVKLLHAGHYGRDALARFARERDILAGLTHPNIARLYDAGTTGTGQPYIALEYVEGAPLVAYCDERRLGLGARLALFGQVLRAVQYAHSNLVIHRDLKPSNILVTAGGEVRLLDFGIAKPLEEAAARAPALTALGARALTPDYASPEQIRGEPVSTASDVYSLGVVLYELLCGSRPYRLRRSSAAALEEAILELEPVRPSEAAVGAAAAALRATTPRQLARALAGDLDTIVLKALKKAPAERYATADAFAQDLERHLAGEPVLARPDQPWYRIGKFIARHRLPVALAAALAAALLVALGVALWSLEATHAQAARAEAAKSMLVKVFSAGNPSSTNGRDITASEILERGSKQIDEELKGQPALLAELHSEIASVYASIGANEEILRHAQQAVRLFEASGERTTDAYFNALYRIADAYHEEERWPEARAAYARLRGEARLRYGPVNEWEARSLEDAIWIEQLNGHLAEAEQASSNALAMMKALFGERSPQYLRVLGSTEQLYLDRGRAQEALEFTRRVIALAPGVPGYALADRLMDRYQLASTLYRLQRYDESASELSRLLPEMEANMGAGNDRTSKARNTLALDLMHLGELEEALALQRRNLELLRDARTGDEALLMNQTGALARILGRSDRFAEALSIQRRVVAFNDAHGAGPTPLHEISRANLGELLVRSGAAAEGLAMLTQALARLDSIAGYQPDPLYAEALLAQGNGYRLLGRSTESNASLARACSLFDAILGDRSIAALRCRLYRLLAAPAEADPAAARATLSQFRVLRDALLAQLAPHQVLRAELVLVEAQLAGRAGDTAEAAALERQGTRLYRERVGVDPHLPLRALH